MASDPSLQPEIGPDGLSREAPVIAYTERIIEEEQLQLRKYIEENYSKIRDVERELANLTMEMKLTAGPKKQVALEHLRKKIEMSTERIRVAKQKEEQARKVWEAASQAVEDEEAMKQKLCEDLNNLVKESSSTQFSRLEELKRRLEALNPSRASAPSPYDGKPMGPAQISLVSDTPALPLSGTGAGVAQNATSNQGDGGNAPVMSGHNQHPTVEGEVKGKKKTHFQGRGKGVGIVPKGRGTGAPGWTGAGFDVDGRS